MFYPDIREFYQPKGFNQVVWARDQLEILDIREGIVGNIDSNKGVHKDYKLIIWSKWRVSGGFKDEAIMEKLLGRFQNIVPVVKVDCVFL